MDILNKINSKSAAVGVIGLGYVGLPLLAAFHRAGFHVIGFDIDPAKIDALRHGDNYLKHLGESLVSRHEVGRAIRSHQRFFPPGRAGCDPHLRPHAAGRSSRAGSFLRSADRRRDRPGAAAGTTGGAGIDHLSANDAGDRPAAAASARPGLRKGFLSRLLPRARRPRPKRFADPPDPQTRRRHRRGRPVISPSPCISRRSGTSSRSHRPRSPKRPSCWRTFTGPSISPWSTR